MDCIDALMPGCTFARGRGRGGIIELARAVGKCGRVVDYVEEVFLIGFTHCLNCWRMKGCELAKKGGEIEDFVRNSRL